jgi:hypothetical protein
LENSKKFDRGKRTLYNGVLHIANMQFLLGKSRLGKQLHELMRQPNIIKKLKEIGCDGVDWINLAQYIDQCQAVMNAAMNIWVS